MEYPFTLIYSKVDPCTMIIFFFKIHCKRLRIGGQRFGLRKVLTAGLVRIVKRFFLLRCVFSLFWYSLQTADMLHCKIGHKNGFQDVSHVSAIVTQ